MDVIRNRYKPNHDGLKMFDVPKKIESELKVKFATRSHAAFSKIKVERDLNHWNNVKKYNEYNENPGP